MVPHWHTGKRVSEREREKRRGQSDSESARVSQSTLRRDAMFSCAQEWLALITTPTSSTLTETRSSRSVCVCARKRHREKGCFVRSVLAFSGFLKLFSFDTWRLYSFLCFLAQRRSHLRSCTCKRACLCRQYFVVLFDPNLWCLCV